MYESKMISLNESTIYSMNKWTETISLAITMIIFFFGLSQYTTGFFLTRYEITNKSNHNPLQPQAQYSKIVVLLVDALRFDFVYPSPDNFAYSNKLMVIQDMIEFYPNNSLLLEFISDPPTVTMQRIKGITTGSLPTFIDFKDNLLSDSIQEDNLLYQMKQGNRKSFFVGDMIWLALLPDGFTEAYPYDSHNVRDLDTVDNGVFQYFRKEINNDWNLIVGHMLGVDHVGHRYHSKHPEMTRKLLEVNEFIKEIIERMDNSTLLLVFGDHGMTDAGNHGGDTINERNSIIFAYSKTEFDQKFKKNRKKIPQIDIVPTLSILLDVGIPFNNLGAVIPELFINSTSHEACVYINVQQISNYLNTYDSQIKKLPDEIYESLQSKYILLENSFKENNFSIEEGLEYIHSAGNMCRDIWTIFDYALMAKGSIIMVLSTVSMVLLTFFPNNFYNFTRNCSISLLIFFISPILSAIYWTLYISKNILNWTLYEEFKILFIACALHGYSLFSNSYILKEDQTIRFVLQGVLAYIWSKKYTHSLLLCSICIRFSAAIDLFTITDEMNKNNYLYNSLILSTLPMLILFYYSNHISRLIILAMLGYWNFEILNIQLLPKLIYALAIISTILLKNFYWSLILVLILVSGPHSPIIFGCALTQIYTASKVIESKNLLGCFLAMTSIQYFYVTGHKCNIQSLIIPSAFIGFDEYNLYISGILLTLNTLASFFLCLLVVYQQKSWQLINCVMTYFLVASTCTTLNTFVNSRHLMVWSIFAPKYIFDNVFLFAISIFCLLILIVIKPNKKND